MITSKALSDISLLLMEYAFFLAISYIIIFLICNMLIKKKGTQTVFLLLTIMTSLAIFTYLFLDQIHLTYPLTNFWKLFIIGNILALTAEVFLYSYRLIILKIKWNKELWLAWWYRDMSFRWAIGETIAYGFALNTPIAFYISGGSLWLAAFMFLFFVGLFFFKRKYPIHTFIPGWHKFMKKADHESIIK